MGGSSNRQKKESSSSSSSSSSSLLSLIFRGKRQSRRSRVVEDDDVSGGRTKAWTSDEDKRNWVAEPGIDRKASIFIAKFHASRVSDSLQCQQAEKH